MKTIKLKNDVVIGKEGMTKKEHFRLTLMEWRATVNAEAKMRPTGSDNSDLHTALANKIYEYFEIDVNNLALWKKDNSIFIKQVLNNPEEQEWEARKRCGAKPFEEQQIKEIVPFSTYIGDERKLMEKINEIVKRLNNLN